MMLECNVQIPTVLWMRAAVATEHFIHSLVLQGISRVEPFVEVITTDWHLRHWNSGNVEMDDNFLFEESCHCCAMNVLLGNSAGTKSINLTKCIIRSLTKVRRRGISRQGLLAFERWQSAGEGKSHVVNSFHLLAKLLHAHGESLRSRRQQVRIGRKVYEEICEKIIKHQMPWCTRYWQHNEHDKYAYFLVITFL